MEQFHNRINGYLLDFIPRVEAQQHNVIMLVTHAASVVGLARGLSGDPELAFRVGCCSLTEFVRTEGEDWEVIGGWERRKLADVTHFGRDWGFGDN